MRLLYGLGPLALVALISSCGGRPSPSPAEPKRTSPPPVATQVDAPPPAPPPPQAAEEDTAGVLSIFAVDIGQGDASVILGPVENGRRRALVVDAGDRAPSGSKIVRAILQAESITELDYVILSHFDSDHLGGFVVVQGSKSLLWEDANCTPGPLFPKVLISDQGTDTNKTNASKQWKKCVPKIAASTGTTHIEVEGGKEIGRVLDLGGGYTATIVAGDGYVLADTATRVAKVDTPNERSTAVLVSGTDGFDMLITGDLIGQKPAGSTGKEDARVEGALGAALKKEKVDVEVLRTGHHGAANATELGFVKDIQPEVAIISTGDDQTTDYKHPRCETYQALKDAKVGLVLQTELGKSDCQGNPAIKPVIVDGSIRIDVTGSSYSIASVGPTSANGKATAAMTYACTLVGGCTSGPTPAPPTPPSPGPRPAPPGPSAGPCCKVCTTSVPCGDACIPRDRTCSKPPGCACAGSP